MAWQLILGDETIHKKKKTLREVLAEESSKTLLEKFATGFSIFLGPLFYFFSWLLILLVLLVLGFIRLVNAIFGRVARIYLFRRCS